MSKYRVTDEVTAEIYEAESPADAVDQFLNTGYDTGEMPEGESWEGIVEDMDGERVAGYMADADGKGGVRSYSMIA